MREVVEHIARSLVDHPEAVRVSEVTGERSVTLQLSVAPEDMGKVIGKGGRTARAIRAVVRAAATRAGTAAAVEIVG